MERGLLLTHGGQVHALIADAFTSEQESLLVLFADRQHRLLQAEWMGQGSVSIVRCSWRALFARALALDSRAILLAHNHPSGSAAPSSADLAATQQVVRMAGLLAIELIDHLIVARGLVHSMREAGQIVFDR